MESSQSTSKCVSSDFSIERILSDSRSLSDRADTPSWLCCTRYRPPRLPRSESGGGSRARRSGRHARVPFTGAQAAALEAAYSRSAYLAPPALRALAAALSLREDRIKIWFQNRRARERREKSTNITPPFEITLPPSIPPYRSIHPQELSLVAHGSKETTSQTLLYCTQNFRAASVVFNEFGINTTIEKTSTCPDTSFSDEDRPETPLDIETYED